MAYLDSPFERCVAERGGSLTLAIASGQVMFPARDRFSQHMRDMVLFMINADAAQRPSISAVLDRIESLHLADAAL